MHIIVIGAGLAGLTVAIALTRAGHKVDIVESAPKITYIGAGIQLSPNSSRVLRKLGIDKYIERFCTEPVDLRMMRWENGQKLVECPLKTLAQEEYGSPYWHIHRADFHQGLLQCATDMGCEIFLDSKVVQLEPEVPALVTEDQRRFVADLIIASDGLHSTCRHTVVGKQSPPEPTGQMAYRVTVPVKRLEGIPELQEIITVPRNNHWIGPHGTILSYLLEGMNEKLVNLVFTCDVRMPDGVNQQPGTADEVREAFKGWDPKIDLMLGFVSEVLEWRLYTHNELPTWTHPSHRITLIGDAAHAMTPYLAQGAAMGIEDAATLGGIFARVEYTSPSMLPQALKLYEKLRIKRTSAVASASIGSRRFTQMEDGEEQRERDEWLLAHPGICNDHINIRSRKEFLDYLFGYDTYKALDEALVEESNNRKSPEK